MSLTLALDVGSSSVRAMLFDAQGRAQDGIFVQKPYPSQTTPDGGVMIDPTRITTLILECLDEAVQQASQVESTIERVAMDTLVGNLMGIDADGQPTTPIYTWADTRGGALGAALSLDRADYTRRSGCRLHTSYWPVRLLWLHQQHPDVCDRTRYWLSLGEYALYRIFGQRRISLSTASWSGLLNRHELAWDMDMLDHLPVTIDQLSEISNAPFEGLSGQWAARWPALKDARWHPSIGDGVASNVGGDCSRPGDVALSLGTSGAMRVVVAGTPAQTPDGLFVYRIDAERSLVGGALSNAGNLYAWLNRVLATGDEADLQQAVGQIAPDSHGLTILPFLAGERAPGWNARAQAVFMGMTFDTRPEHLVRAALEAVAYRFDQILRRLQPLLPDEVQFIANGAGLVNSPVWMQIMADVLGAPVYASAQAEATIRGTALLAMGAQPPVERGPGCTPDAARHAIYRQAVERQQVLYHKLLT
ncbi:MAG: gluconokinase [Anaerolineae bacterium]|nr:gluconokinase [Anaerolineae bacterium]